VQDEWADLIVALEGPAKREKICATGNAVPFGGGLDGGRRSLLLGSFPLRLFRPPFSSHCGEGATFPPSPIDLLATAGVAFPVAIDLLAMVRAIFPLSVKDLARWRA